MNRDVVSFLPHAEKNTLASGNNTMGYPTDVTDEEWAEVAPALSKAAPTGRSRTVDVRQVYNALRSKNRTSCQWSMLPEGFPPKSTVFDYRQK